MLISGWGNFPIVNATKYEHWCVNQIQNLIKQTKELIPSGLLRSYGDCALNTFILTSTSLNKILEFNPEQKRITCESGISFKDLINFLGNYNLTLPVTPGTKFITIGGAIASDIHGKNHHLQGTFGSWIESLRIIDANGDIHNCSNTENPELFAATIGGMGLTGFILDATIKLVDLNSALIDQKTIKARDLAHLFELFEEHKNEPFSVSWIDTNSSIRKIGRGVLFIGKTIETNIKLKLIEPKISLPFYFPNFTLNKITISLLNNAYYFANKDGNKIVHFDKFFYPLDAIRNWNRGYGRNGFFQYQFVVPKDLSYKTIKKVLSKMEEIGIGSFLTVLKLMGPQNNFLLSFPMEGYTLAMDFPLTRKSRELADELDKIILDSNGRIYLTKDSRMNKDIFWQTYPNLHKFLEIKSKYDPNNRFQSLQSKRLGITI